MYKKTLLLLIAASFSAASAADQTYETENFKAYIRHCVENSHINKFDPKMEGSMFSWEFNGKYKVVYADRKIFSYRTEELSYTGGANGNFTVNVGTMHRENGKKITLKDIAPTAKQRRKLLSLITEQTAEKFKCSIKDLPKKLLNMPELTENFCLNASGITFVYNEYEIASKGAGAINIFIPYRQFPIGSVLNKD